MCCGSAYQSFGVLVYSRHCEEQLISCPEGTAGNVGVRGTVGQDHSKANKRSLK